MIDFLFPIPNFLYETTLRKPYHINRKWEIPENLEPWNSGTLEPWNPGTLEYVTIDLHPCG